MTFDQRAFNDIYFASKLESDLEEGKRCLFLLRTLQCSVDFRLQNLGEEESLSIRRWRSLNVITDSSCSSLSFEQFTIRDARIADGYDVSGYR